MQRLIKATGKRPTEIARESDVSQSTLSRILQGKIESPSDRQVAKLASYFGLSSDQIRGREEIGDQVPERSPGHNEVEFFGHLEPWDDDTPLEADEVELPLFREVEIAAGSGRTQVIENHGAKLRFARRTLRKAGVMKEHAACAYVSGDSMEPVLPDGTTVGVNTADTRVMDGKLYVIDHDGLLRVKQLHRLPGGGLRIRSFNQAEFPDEDLGPDWPEQVRIKGKVFWSSTMW
ncbi:HTH-type transcriptional regulator PrtR [Bisbaumannia pacifica]|uniref:HTH-type transcriptional regulator PrtR n=1 Tax=Bisbaumannia pacifica TaxID=77098 RepID=A0A510XGU9_9GAMM|nr:HTH-type transcriptional regulator PrtR [Halomonas pacifica]